MHIPPVPGTAESVKASYEKAWEATHTRITKELASGDHIASVLARMGRLKLDHHMPSSWRDDPAIFAVGRRVLHSLGIDDRDFRNPFYPAVVDGRYTVNSGFNSSRYLFNNVTPATTVILELGSGWSANLFQLYVLLGQRASRNVQFVGAEYTEQGRSSGQLLADHDGTINYTSVPFDWTQPDLSFLEQLERPVNLLAFSHHSVEQVPYIDPDVWTQLAGAAETVTCIHIEPVGWQRQADLLAHRKADDAAHFSAIAERLGVHRSDFRVPWGTDDAFSSVDLQVQAAAWWSWVRRYNINLLEEVDARNGVSLRVRQVMFDFDSLLNPLNPSTLVNLDLTAAAGTGA